MELLLWQAVVLGIIEGLTEFLPVSSTGHLIIGGELIGFVGERAKTFEIFIQLGSITGIVWFYRARLLTIARQIEAPASRRLLINLLIAFLPAAVVGLLFHRLIKAHLFSPLTVALALVLGGIAILLIERIPLRARHTTIETIGRADAFRVGLAQMLALFPGVSRAGATIMGGLLSGLSRQAATEFSFFLAIPTMFAATLFELYKNLPLLDSSDAALLAVGFLTSFFVAVWVVRAFLAWISRHDFRVFGWYRIFFGLIVLAYFW
jgi:undecaprenyl-diphosphatase